MDNYPCELVLSRVRSLQKKLVIETLNGKQIYFVKPKKLAVTKSYVVFDPEGNNVAKVEQCISLMLPKYRIVIKDGAIFYVTRKFSLLHDYSVKGMPWIVTGDFTSFRYRVLDHSGNNVFEIRKEPNNWGNRYVIKVSESNMVLYGICLSIAIDAAISAVHS